ncbi:aminotransferase [Pseudaestuariivita sp.]|uniref:aminotransferase n=1 Tax=Pseudaestuariivita sp. TaxID=2211669 RepID=UPI0040595AA8
MSLTSRTFSSPVTEAYRWLDTRPPSDLPLLNAAQAAPADPPPPPLRAHMAELMLHDDAAHKYTGNWGLREVREAAAATTSRLYGGAVTAGQVGLTSGCNQAFVAAMASLVAPGDEVILPVPWYFNHAMWLDMAGAVKVPLPTGPDMLPDPELAASRITSRTRAIVLVSPNNPTGAEYPPDLLTAFRDLARARGIALVLDETYRDFLSTPGAPHDLFTDPDWDEVLIHLYSFSKSYHLTGHRVGALVTSEARLEDAAKFIDTVTICPTPLGQKAALYGMTQLTQWLAEERETLLARRAEVQRLLPQLEATGWHLSGLGGYFAYLRHPFAAEATQVAKTLLHDQSVLCLPGTFFAPDGDAEAARHLRVAFANMDHAGLGDLAARLAALKV